MNIKYDIKVLFLNWFTFIFEARWFTSTFAWIMCSSSSLKGLLNECMSWRLPANLGDFRPTLATSGQPWRLPANLGDRLLANLGDFQSTLATSGQPWATSGQPSFTFRFISLASRRRLLDPLSGIHKVRPPEVRILCMVHTPGNGNFSRYGKVGLHRRVFKNMFEANAFISLCKSRKQWTLHT
jgi:hypothetical protein